MAALAAPELELPDEQTVKQAGEAVRYLNGLSGADSSGVASVRLVGDSSAQEPVKVDLPRKAVRIIIDVLAELAKGNAVTVVPVQADLTTQQAANILNVSRPYLVGLLDEGKIPHRMVGNRRRVLLPDLLEYKRVDDAYRATILDELTKEAERIGLEY